MNKYIKAKEEGGENTHCEYCRSMRTHARYWRKVKAFCRKFAQNNNKKTNCSTEEICKKGGDYDNKISVDTHKLIKSIYILMWAGTLCFYICQFYEHELMPKNLVGVYNLILFIVSMFLNGFSYYLCIAYVYFIRVLSKIERGFDKWSHNKYKPSLSNGYRVLFNNARHIAFISLLIALLYTFAYFVLMTFIIGSSENHSINEFFIMTLLTFLFGICTTIVLFIAPMFFFQRIIDKWKNYGMRELQEEIDSCSAPPNYSELQAKLGIMNDLNNDRVRYSHGTIFSFIMTITMIVINVINVCILLVDENPIVDVVQYFIALFG